MHSLLPNLTGTSNYTGVTFVAILLVLVKWSRPSKLDAIPTIGSSTWFGSWFAGVKYIINGLDVIQEGYEKLNRAPFKIAVFHHWMVVLSSCEHVQELHRAPDNALSILDGLNDTFQVEYTMGHGIHHNPYHTSVVRSKLARNAAVLYPETWNEIVTAFDDILELNDNGWRSVPAFDIVQKVVCRTTSRQFVGLALCRDPAWVDLNLKFMEYVVKGAMVIKFFPAFLKPLAAWLFRKLTQSNERGSKLLGPVIEERQIFLNKYGNEWADKPNDLLSWLMEKANGPELTAEALSARVLALSFVAIQTTTMAFTNALFHLAESPEHNLSLREEVEPIIETEGWSKASLNKMRKVDSFLRESERMEGFNGVNLVRKAVKDYTFSDGTFVPKGTTIAAASTSIHYDETLYPDAHTFKPFRFAELCDESKDGESAKHQFVSTGLDYLTFGHGRHACPGRVFAVDELKSMLAHVVVTYDVKFEGKKGRPQALRIGTSVIPDSRARVMFRKRAV